MNNHCSQTTKNSHAAMKSKKKRQLKKYHTNSNQRIKTTYVHKSTIPTQLSQLEMECLKIKQSQPDGCTPHNWRIQCIPQKQQRLPFVAYEAGLCPTSCSRWMTLRLHQGQKPRVTPYEMNTDCYSKDSRCLTDLNIRNCAI